MNNELQAFSFCEETIKLKHGIEREYVELCARLYKIREERLYESQYEDWQVFLEEMKMTPSVASRLCKIYQVFILEQGFSKKELEEAGGWSVVSEILKVEPNKKQSEELLSLAKIYTRKHLRDHIQKMMKCGSDDCKHTTTYLVRICEDCGIRMREYEEK